MTFGAILSQLYERLNYASTPATAVQTRLKNAVNDAYRRILREPGLALVRDTSAGLTFASVAAQDYYGLPSSIARVRAITERTNDRRLTPMSMSALRASDPGLSMSGTPWAYVPIGVRPIKALPDSTGIWAVSSSAADTTQTIQIEGTRSGGLPSGDQTATLNGATRQAIGSLTDYVDLTSVSLSAVAAGTVTLYDAAAAGTVLGVIPIGYTSPAYFGIQLYPTPTDAITYYVDGTLRLLDLDDNDDVPLLPEEFHDLLIVGALVTEYEKQDDPRLGLSQRLYDKGLSRLKYWASAQPDDLPVLGAPRRRGYSRLGAWTPAD